MSWQRLKRMVRHECKGRPVPRQKAMRQRFNEMAVTGAPEVTREIRAYVLMGPGPLTGGYGRPPPSAKKKAAAEAKKKRKEAAAAAKSLVMMLEVQVCVGLQHTLAILPHRSGV